MSMSFINEERILGTLLERNRRLMEMQLMEKKNIIGIRTDPQNPMDGVIITFQFSRNSDDSTKIPIGEDTETEETFTEDFD